MLKSHSVFCCWQYEPRAGKGPTSRCWKLVESYGNSGYSLLNTGNMQASQEWENWLSRHDGDPDSWESTPIMGRAVTAWEFGYGIRLVGLNPPEWVPWLSASFYRELQKLPNWHEFLDCGYDLFFGTIKAADKIIEEASKSHT